MSEPKIAEALETVTAKVEMILTGRRGVGLGEKLRPAGRRGTEDEGRRQPRT